MSKKVKKVPKTTKRKTTTTTKKPIRKPTNKRVIHKQKPFFETFTNTVISTVPLTTTPPIIIKEDGENWAAIRKISESAIKFYRDYHDIKSCDTELARRLNEIEGIARNNHLVSHIIYILRSRQSLIDKLRQIYRYALKKSN